MEPIPNMALKVAIVRAQKKQRDIAKRAHIHEARFSAIANGRIVPNLAEQKRIAHALKMTVDQVFPDAIEEASA